MKSYKAKSKIIFIFIAAFFALTFFAHATQAATYYFDAVNGNDNTGAPNDSNHPYQTLDKLDDFFSAGSIHAGDFVKFKKGNTDTEQTFRNSAIFVRNASGSAGAPITLTSYGSGNYKPVISAVKTITDHTSSGWTNTGSNNVWYYAGGGDKIFEDDIPLRGATSSACSNGRFYYDSGAGRTYYKLPAGDNPGNHIVARSFWGTALYLSETNGQPNNYFTIDGLKFVAESGLSHSSRDNEMTNWIIQNCEFWHAGISLMDDAYSINDITIQNNKFNYCQTTSIALEGGTYTGLSFLRANVLNNLIQNNGRMPDGNPWNDNGPDADCIAIQNITDSNFIGNDISGYVAGPTPNNAITYYFGSGPDAMTVDNVTNVSGKIRVTAHWNHDQGGYWLKTGMRVFLWGIGGCTNANGVWTISVPNGSTNTFDLDSSTFGPSSYTSGGSGGQETTRPQSGNVFAKNYIHDIDSGYTGDDSNRTGCGLFLSMGFQSPVDSDHQIQVYDNIITNLSHPLATGIISAGRNALSAGSLIANNTIVNADEGIRFGGGYTVKNNILRNIHGNYMAQTNYPYAHSNVDNNGYSGVTGSAFYFPGIGNVNLAAWKTNIGGDSNSITSDPLFVNASAGTAAGFALQAGSPAINAGANVGLATDYAGNAIQGNPDIGAYEYQGTAPPPAPITGDLNADGAVNVTDFGIIKTDFLKLTASLTNPKSDIDADGQCTIKDVGILMSGWK